jgi:hypothetical protein
MSNSYKWSIPEYGLITANTNSQNNVVTFVRYSVTGNDSTNTHSVTLTGTAKIPFNANNTFISYNSLTSDLVLFWVQNTNPKLVTQQQNQIDQRLNQLINPPQTPKPQKLPW